MATNPFPIDLDGPNVSEKVLAHAAHELSNPCSAGRLSAETALDLLERGGDGNQLRLCLENIISALDHCDRIILGIRLKSPVSSGLTRGSSWCSLQEREQF